ncbi:Tuberous sclerosis 2-like protein [Exophiala xenobiotica]|uniref:Tuberous sclerosis 2-like protein n=1 Tax=Lithohypha guttulata TaxID=1690604 RepID=A0ABR0K2D7_9EURO|nr:Tuberous sclerosis 2-like protein [Lithohypha guttulata]KAK5312421.1 Tuberous sclerosis 2-like protein [Exophiala xenobiotica]
MVVTGQPNGMPRDVDTHSQGSCETSREEPSLKPDIGFISPSRVEHEAPEYSQTSQDTRAWLASFGDLKPDTDVSWRFRIEEKDYPEEEPRSMLPLLTTWLRLWFGKSLKEPQYRADLLWLLQYTADYIDLGHCTLHHDEVLELCLALLHTCKNARQHSHIEGCLLVFLSITQVHAFPRESLGQVLGTLSTAIVLLERPLSRITECVKILATGDLRNETTAAIYSQLLTVNNNEALQEPDTSKYITPARGAVRHLVTLLEVDVDEKPVLDMTELLQVLKEASKANILRLATEILNLLTKCLLSERVKELSASEKLITLLLAVYDTCEEANIVPEALDHSQSKNKLPKDDQAKRELRYKRDHEKSSRHFRDALGSLLPLMPHSSAKASWEVLKPGVENLSTAGTAGLVDYVNSRRGCLPGNVEEWHEDLLLLLDKIVIKDSDRAHAQSEEERQHAELSSGASTLEQVDQRVAQRIEILDLCALALRELAQKSDEPIERLPPGKTAHELGMNALQKLLAIFTTGQNSEVLRAFLDKLVSLADAMASSGNRPYSLMIVQTLQDKIVAYAPNDNTAEATYFAGTEALRAIFLQSLDSQSDLANHAYQALLKIANCKECRSRRCRLAAMSLLLRIRCNTSGLVYIDRSAESAYIASAVCKTDESLSSMFADSDTESEETSRKLRYIHQRQLWMYPREETAFDSWEIPENVIVRVEGSSYETSDRDLDMSDWLWVVATNLQEDKDWDTFSYIIVHFGTQLVNSKLFESSLDEMASLRGYLSGRVREPAKMFEPPQDIGLAKVDVALCFYHILMRMIPYYKLQPPNPNMPDSGRKGIDLVRAFRSGIDLLYEGTARSCIHALSICCFETPEAIGSEYPAIVDVMARNITRSHILVHILEFLAQVARLPQLHRYFMESEIEKIFVICTTAISARRSETAACNSGTTDSKRSSSHANAHTRRTGGLQTPYRAAMLKEKGLTQYSCALAYHTLIFWFLAIPISQRHKHINAIIRRLTWEDKSGHETVDQQTIVLIDLMQRTAFSDLPETKRDESFDGDEYERTSYVDGNAVVTLEIHQANGRTQITKRQPAGTTHAVFEPQIQQLPQHHDRAFSEELDRRGYSDRVTPSHTLLNMIGSAVPFALSEQPLKLNPNESYVDRAIRTLDRKSTVDSHKIAITLLRDGQTEESEYLANMSGSTSFDGFLDTIGTRMSLKPPCAFVPFGLAYDIDGTETVAWRDRINEIVFEVTTMMPTVEGDPYQTRKKSQVGNCLVLIVFNQSNRPWKWDNFKSQATLVQIVITPANRVSKHESSDDFEHEYFQVEVLTKEEYQNTSAAAEVKVVSKATLAPFVRILALNANIFAECARNESTGDAEFPSSWRYRLQEIVQLRERTQQRVHDNEETLAKRYDFSRWT